MGNSLVMVVDLKGESNNTLRVLRSFEQHRMRNVVVGGNTSRAVKSLPASIEANEEALHDSGDDSSEETGENDQSLPASNVPSVSSTVNCMATSMDGQWLASADTRHRIHVFNLDSVQVFIAPFPIVLFLLTISRRSIIVPCLHSLMLLQHSLSIPAHQPLSSLAL
jgi:hypothetical protein